MNVEKKMEELEIFLRTDEKTFSKNIEGQTLDEHRNLEVELESLINITKNQPLQNRKISNLLGLLKREISIKEREQQKVKKQTDEDWAKNFVPANLYDLRVLTNPTTVQNIRSGVMCSEDTREWEKLKDTNIEVVTRTGRKVKINLMQFISPQTWRMIFENPPLQTYFFAVEAGGGATKRGKFIGFWRKDEGFNEERTITPIIHDSYLAIRRV